MLKCVRPLVFLERCCLFLGTATCWPPSAHAPKRSCSECPDDGVFLLPLIFFVPQEAFASHIRLSLLGSPHARQTRYRAGKSKRHPVQTSLEPPQSRAIGRYPRSVSKQHVSVTESEPGLMCPQNNCARFMHSLFFPLTLRPRTAARTACRLCRPPPQQPACAWTKASWTPGIGDAAPPVERCNASSPLR